MAHTVGGEVKTSCGKCKDTTVHIIHSMRDGAIYRVHCKRRKGEHQYRGAKPKAATSATTTRKKSPTKTRKSAYEPAVAANLLLPVAEYKPSVELEVGQRISHAKFGDGIVEEIADKKATVFFPDGRKVLIFGRPVPN